MGTPMPGGGRHRRRIRIALPVAAAGVAGALLTSSAGAATALPQPKVRPAADSPSPAELQQRVAGAMAGDDVAGKTSKTALTAGTVAGSIDPKVIGGNETTISTAPWMAQLH